MQCNACQNDAQEKKKCLMAVSVNVSFTLNNRLLFLVIGTTEILTQYSLFRFEFLLCNVVVFLKLKTSLHYLSAETKTVQGHFAAPLTHSMNEAVQSRGLLNLDQNFSLSIFHDALTMGLKCKA